MVLVSVVFNLPAYQSFDYVLESVPAPACAAERDFAQLYGVRVTAPFGGRILGGYVVAAKLLTAAEADQLDFVPKPIHELIDRRSLLGQHARELAEFCASYYHQPLGMFLSLVLPFGVLAHQSVTLWALSADSKQRMGADSSLSAAMRRVLDGLGAGAVSAAELKLAGHSAQTLQALQRRGYLVEADLSTGVDTGTDTDTAAEQHVGSNVRAAQPATFELTSAQKDAVDQVTATFGSFAPFLLYGVTGSGKTQVYLSLARQALAANKHVLILVPEINLTLEFARQLESELGVPVAMVHSQVPHKIKDEQWQLIQSGHVKVVLGTRSAVFAPITPGLIVVDEEHDVSFKQDTLANYNAKDLCLKLGQLHSCPVVLGSATPSLETLLLAKRGKVTQLNLPRRADQAPLPLVSCVDLREQQLVSGLHPQVLSRMHQTLKDGFQVLVFINRRGYAPVIFCTACSSAVECPNCSVSLAWHKQSSKLICHHCGFTQKAPQQCPSCNSPNLNALGVGTQQVEETLAQRFAGFDVVRIDSDTAKTAKGFEALSQSVRSNKPMVLIGTQMLSKGHHFSQVKMAVVVGADQGLYSQDFRGNERTLQQLTQVAGRAGRESVRGEVVVQSFNPEHPELLEALKLDYLQAADKLLQTRQSVGLPPYAHAALIHAHAKEERCALEALNAVLESIKAFHIRWFGPAFAPIKKKKNMHHAQLLLLATQRSQLHSALKLLKYTQVQRAQIKIEVDPVQI